MVADTLIHMKLFLISVRLEKKKHNNSQVVVCCVNTPNSDTVMFVGSTQQLGHVACVSLI